MITSIEKTHISEILAGDTIFKDGHYLTVNKSNIKRGFFGKTLFGDSYMNGSKLVKKAIIQKSQVLITGL